MACWAPSRAAVSETAAARRSGEHPSQQPLIRRPVAAEEALPHGARTARTPGDRRERAAGRHLRRPDGLRDGRRHRTRPRHRAPNSPGSARPSSSRAASPSTSPTGSRRSRHIGGKVLTVGCDIRDPEQISAAFDARRRRVRAAGRAGQQRRRELPGAGRGHVAERLAHRRRHHAQRHVLLRPRVRPAPLGGRHARLDHQRRRLVRVDRRSRLRSLGRRQGGREEHGRDARRSNGVRTASR